MIQSVRIKNIESWEDVLIEFVEGVNVIVGSSDGGKSAVLNALNWAFRNSPRGMGHKSWFAKSSDPMSVGVLFMDSKGLIRERSNEHNRYLFEGKEFDAIRNDVPDEVREFINLEDYNLSGQLDKYFLLQSTPGEAAKKFSEVLDFDIINKLTMGVNSLVSTTNREKESIERDIAGIEIDLAPYQDLDSVIKRARKLKSKIESTDRLLSRLHNIEKIVSDVQGLERIIESDKEWLEIEKPLNRIKGKAVALSELENRRNRLGNIVESIERRNAEIEDSKEFIKIEKSEQKVRKLLKETDELDRRSRLIESCLNRIADFENKIEIQRMAIDVYVKSAIDVVKDLKRCPLCDAEFRGKDVEKHVRHWLGVKK